MCPDFRKIGFWDSLRGRPTNKFFIDLLGAGQQIRRMGHPKFEKKMKEMRLTHLQRQVAHMLIEGKDVEEIQAALGRTPSAVTSIIKECYTKADVKSRHKFTALFLLASDL